MRAAGPNQLFLIVASTDAAGAEVLSKRIREQLENCVELKASTSFTVSAEALSLPAPQDGKPVTAMVEEIADRITEVARAGNMRRA